MEQVLSLKEMEQLPALEYQFSQFLIDTDGNPVTEHILLRSESSIVINTDLSTLSPADINITDNAISLILPKPTITTMPIRLRNINKEDLQDHGKILSDMPAKDTNQISRARHLLQQKIDSLQLLSKAEEQTTLFVSRYLQTQGFSRISIRYASTSK